MRRFKKGSRNSRLTLNACIESNIGLAGRVQSSVSGKACRGSYANRNRSRVEEKDRMNDKEEDKVSCRGKGCNFRGGTVMATHRLGQLDHDKSPRETGERSRGIVLRESYTSVYLTGALMRERRDG